MKTDSKKMLYIGLAADALSVMLVFLSLLFGNFLLAFLMITVLGVFSLSILVAGVFELNDSIFTFTTFGKAFEIDISKAKSFASDPKRMILQIEDENGRVFSIPSYFFWNKQTRAYFWDSLESKITERRMAIEEKALAEIVGKNTKGG